LAKATHRQSLVAPHPLTLRQLADGLLLVGLNMLAVVLLGEMQVRHYHEPSRRAPYYVDRVIRAHSSEEHSVPE
jgi:hypothetical protein